MISIIIISSNIFEHKCKYKNRILKNLDINLSYKLYIKKKTPSKFTVKSTNIHLIFELHESKSILITKDGKMILSLTHIITILGENLLDFFF